MKPFLRCILLPLQNQTLVVPYSAIAEIIPFEAPTREEDAPNWFLGKLTWRETDIPVINLETLQDPTQEFIQNQHLHIAILNRVKDNLPDFIGIILQNLPTMTRLKRSDVTLVQENPSPSILMEVKVRETPAFIPNLAWIEEQ